MRSVPVSGPGRRRAPPTAPGPGPPGGTRGAAAGRPGRRSAPRCAAGPRPSRAASRPAASMSSTADHAERSGPRAPPRPAAGRSPGRRPTGSAAAAGATSPHHAAQHRPEAGDGDEGADDPPAPPRRREEPTDRGEAQQRPRHEDRFGAGALAVFVRGAGRPSITWLTHVARDDAPQHGGRDDEQHHDEPEQARRGVPAGGRVRRRRAHGAAGRGRRAGPRRCRWSPCPPCPTARRACPRPPRRRGPRAPC